MPYGAYSVTTMNSPPSTYSQTCGMATVSQLLATFTSTAPMMGPMSVPRPPIAVQMAISIELAVDISLGLMMPTCGAYSAPAMPHIMAEIVHTPSLNHSGL